MADENEGAGGAAPAAGAGGGEGGAGAGEGGFLDALKVSDPTPPAQADAETPAAGEGIEPVPGAEGESEPGLEGKTPEGEVPPKEEPAAPKKLWAGQFEKPEDMEVAHLHSSAEGRRLHKELVQRESALEAMAAELGELKAKLAEGPAFQELTPEQLAEMDPGEKAEYFAARTEHRLRSEQAKEKQAQQQARAKQEQAQLVAGINARIDFMAANPDKFPEYQELGPVMDDLLERASWLAGKPETPDVLYAIAYGRKAMARDGLAKKASAASEEKRKKDAAAAAARAGSMGPTPGGKGPAKQPAAGSDEAHNAAIIKAGRTVSHFS